MKKYKATVVLLISIISFLGLAYPIPALAEIQDELDVNTQEPTVKDTTCQIDVMTNGIDSLFQVFNTNDTPSISESTVKIEENVSVTNDGVTWNNDFTIATLTGMIDGQVLSDEIALHRDMITTFIANPNSVVTGDCSSVFENCSQLRTVDANNMDTSQVTNMHAMFSGSGITSLDGITDWDVSNVTGDKCMSKMFYGCKNLTSLGPIANWNLAQVHGIHCMSEMFGGTGVISLNDFQSFNVSNVYGDYCMAYMFSDCQNLQSLDGLENWQINDKINNESQTFTAMFSSCHSLENAEALENWEVLETNTRGMFSECTSIKSFKTGKFKLYTNMLIPETFSTGGNYWYPSNNPETGYTTVDMINALAESSASGVQWARNTGFKVVASIEGQGSIISQNPPYAKHAGSLVQISFKPDNGWAFEDGNFIATDAEGNDVTVINDGQCPDGTYTYEFMMPGSDVTIKLIFIQSPDPSPSPTPTPPSSPDIDWDLPGFNFDFSLPDTGDSNMGYLYGALIAIVPITPIILFLLIAYIIDKHVQRKQSDIDI